MTTLPELSWSVTAVILFGYIVSCGHSLSEDCVTAGVGLFVTFVFALPILAILSYFLHRFRPVSLTLLESGNDHNPPIISLTNYRTHKEQIFKVRRAKMRHIDRTTLSITIGPLTRLLVRSDNMTDVLRLGQALNKFSNASSSLPYIEASARLFDANMILILNIPPIIAGFFIYSFHGPILLVDFLILWAVSVIVFYSFSYFHSGRAYEFEVIGDELMIQPVKSSIEEGRRYFCRLSSIATSNTSKTIRCRSYFSVFTISKSSKVADWFSVAKGSKAHNDSQRSQS